MTPDQLHDVSEQLRQAGLPAADVMINSLPARSHCAMKTSEEIFLNSGFWISWYNLPDEGRKVEAEEAETLVVSPLAPELPEVEEPEDEETDGIVEEYEAEEAAGPSGPRAREGLATLYLCERGHRTLAVWSAAPETCHAPVSRKKECGRPVYHSTELPEQVQKALNPIKASKKSSPPLKGCGDWQPAQKCGDHSPSRSALQRAH